MQDFIPSELPINIKLNDNTYKILSKASRKLGELNGFAKTIPNQDILINSLVLQEAKDSSAIENIITTHDELFLAQIDESAITKNTKEVQNYEQALKRGFFLIKRDRLLLNRHILEIQKTLERNNAGFRVQSGTMLKNHHTGEIKHIPPQHRDDIVRLMNNLEKYINEELDDLDPLIRLAIIHYQFETIHPFYDGNGRSGRILNVLYLVHKELLDLPILYLSAYIIKHKQDYYNLLSEVSKNKAWDKWINYILEGIEKTAEATIKRIEDIKEAMNNYSETLKDNTKIYSKDLIDTLFAYPYTKIESLEKTLQITRQTSSKYLKICEELKLLECVNVQKKKYYINVKLFEILSKELLC